MVSFPVHGHATAIITLEELRRPITAFSVPTGPMLVYFTLYDAVVNYYEMRIPRWPVLSGVQIRNNTDVTIALYLT